MSDNTPILTGKRKRAAVSYTEPDDLLELQSDEEQEELPVQAQLTDSDDDETYGSRSKVSSLVLSLLQDLIADNVHTSLQRKLRQRRSPSPPRRQKRRSRSASSICQPSFAT